MSANADLIDSAIDRSIDIEFYKNRVARKYIELLKGLDAKINVILSIEFSDLSRSELNEALREVNQVMSAAYVEIQTDLKKEMLDLADAESEHVTNAINRAISLELATRPDYNAIYNSAISRPFHGRLLSEWFIGLQAAARRRLEQRVKIGYVEGQTTQQIVSGVIGTRAASYKDGILNLSRNDATAVIRTSLAHMSSFARQRVYEANEDIVKGVMWLSTLDTRTTPICRSRDKKIYALDSGTRPPAHVGCRSTIQAVLKSYRAIDGDAPEATRASMDGQVSNEINYNDWLKRQSAERQDEVLGRAKGRLFREGGLTVDRFVNRQGKEYTLGELRRREREAYKQVFGEK